jgi:hypothetical protein
MNIHSPKKHSIKQRVDGMEVRNATVSLALEIIPADTKAARKDPRHCVAAECIRRLPKVKDVRVHLSRTFILFKGKKYYLRWVTPKSLRAELIAFDRGGEFEPGKYILPIPKEYMKKPGGNDPRPGGNFAAKRAKVFRHMTLGVRPAA